MPFEDIKGHSSNREGINKETAKPLDTPCPLREFAPLAEQLLQWRVTEKFSKTAGLRLVWGAF